MPLGEIKWSNANYSAAEYEVSLDDKKAWVFIFVQPPSTTIVAHSFSASVSDESDMRFRGFTGSGITPDEAILSLINKIDDSIRRGDFSGPERK